MSHRDGYPPIADYALLSDCRSRALVASDGGIDWCDFHKDGSHPVCSAILDHRRGGTFRIAPTVEVRGTSRRYLPDTNVLETTFETDTGTVTVTDALVLQRHSDPHRAVAVVPHDQLVREVACVDGEVDVELQLAPRFEYGLTRPHVRLVDERRAVVTGGGDAVLVDSDRDGLTRGDWHSCAMRMRLRAGQRWHVGMTYVLPHLVTHHAHQSRPDMAERLRTTIDFWQRWSSRCTYEGPHRDLVVRSALVLKALTDAATGAIIAAPTTSLPEDPGGSRNWDYRYTWIRDAAMHLEALFGLGYRNEAEEFVRYLTRATAGTADDLQVLYGSRGQRLVPEMVLEGLDGYVGSRPVRIGNAAVRQFQLDVYGHVCNVAWRYDQHGGRVGEELAHLLRDSAQMVAERWRDPDRGLWEVRSTPRRFVASLLYAWVAIDRVVRLADRIGLDRVDDWRTLAGEIREELLTRGTDDAGALTQSLDERGADAASLLVPLEGLLEPDDARVRATLRLVCDELTADGDGALLYRYLTPDGLPGSEGAFVLCSFWLVSVLAARGEVDEAERTFSTMLDHANDLGLLSEEIEPTSGALLGNFPQAISHAGLIDAALQLAASRAGPGTLPPTQAPWASGDRDEAVTPGRDTP